MNEIAIAQPTTPAPVAEAVPAAPGSLFSPSHVDTNTPAEVAQWMPQKFQVRGADGNMDLEASSQKLAQAYDHAVRRFGKPEGAPESPSAYALTIPEHLELEIPEGTFAPFFERAHEAGLSQAQLDFVMGEYFQALPAFMNDAAAVTLDQAKAELAQAWPDPADMQRNMRAAERAVAAMPPDLQEDVKARFGTDPVFWRFAAHFGKEVGEDRPAAPAGGATGGQDVTALMGSEAYRNPRHKDHARVSAQVRNHFERTAGGEEPYDGLSA
ncbi:hypothetical protein [Hydrogenophaga sp. BPS33]|uniref:hypothetical protein n=1 Tax=Hydrogenophaga sp. BPS33 TaxID=2651974 RepID=UPI00131FC82A|nr:hypothetical protein [Hydrogenophaga sp. BPS33]QHE86316.1 hypothetical protein F9K07_16095 [Hydrogenophaga sp. BPS33]